MVKLLFVLVALLTNSANAALSPVVCSPALLDETRADRYSVSDPSDRDLQVTAWVTPKRQLRINLYTKGKHGQRNPKLRGKDQFDKILKHFKGQFDEIDGLWTVFNVYLPTFDGTDERWGDNLSKFNSLLRQGSSLKDAAFQTWTGQRAKERGYKKVRFEDLRGNIGNYYNVQAIFSR